MAIVPINENQDVPVFANTGDEITLKSSATITGTFGILGSGEDGTELNNHSVTVVTYGDISTSEGGISLSGTTDGTVFGDGNHSVKVGKNSSITVDGASETDVIFVQGQNNQVVNAGTLSGNNFGIRSVGDSATIKNRGTITTDSDAIVGIGSDSSFLNTGTIESGFGGMFINGSNNLIVNKGDLNGANYGIRAYGEANDVRNKGTIEGTQGIELFNLTGTETSYIRNSGTIDTTVDGIFVTGSSSNLRINNSGDILGGAVGVLVAPGSESSVSVRLNNSGTIQGGNGTAIELADASDRVFNSGTINGDVILGGGDDIFDTRQGEVNGTVYGGDGDDVYRVASSDVIIVEGDDEGIDRVAARSDFTLGDNIENLRLLDGGDFNGIGNSQDNRIHGNNQNNSLLGGTGDDRLFGRDGDDRLFGQAGDDRIYGGAGEDDLFGGNGDDRLFGGDANDIILGGVGNDIMRGGDGVDILTGNSGRDIMFGGAGIDRFVFRLETDSTVENADRIRDFESGTDLIILSQLSEGEFEFIDGNDFNGTGAQEVRYQSNGTNTHIRIDVDGDGTEDMRVILNGDFTLTEDDFIL